MYAVIDTRGQDGAHLGVVIAKLASFDAAKQCALDHAETMPHGATEWPTVVRVPDDCGPLAAWDAVRTMTEREQSSYGNALRRIKRARGVLQC